MSTYHNKIYSNHIFNSENSEDLAHLYSDDLMSYNSLYDLNGGSIKDMLIDKPNGGFPPIFIIDSKKEKESEKIKNRQISSNKSTISIKDILKSKK
jgi:hypothetical protein